MFYSVFTYIHLFIIFGVTLLFSTATRSVFEVNKLGVLKIGLCFLIIMYAYNTLISNKHRFIPLKQNRFINIALLIIWLSNILSTIFSQNITISIYGSYDRWEGIITYTFYLLYVFLIANYNENNSSDALCCTHRPCFSKHRTHYERCE